VQQQTPVGGDCDLPVEVTALHVFDRARVDACVDGCLTGGDNVAGAQDPGGQSWWSSRLEFVELKPARASHRGSVRINGNHFQITGFADLQESVVCAQSRVFTAGLHSTAQSLFDITDTIGQCSGCEHEVIELAGGCRHREFPALSSASTRKNAAAKPRSTKVLAGPVL